MKDLLETMVISRIRELGHDSSFLARASEIVVFGSRAAGLESPDSDLDVLCVGTGSRLKSRSLDLSWVSEDIIRKDEWLGSELAGHIAQYGIWVRGKSVWRADTFTSVDTIERKQKRILSLSRTVTRLWTRLHPVFRSQYNVNIRRELQRLMLLERQGRIPPTRMLDDDWRRKGRRELFKFKSSIEQLKGYEGRSNTPEILRRSQIIC